MPILHAIWLRPFESKLEQIRLAGAIRAFIPARAKGKDGLPLFKWADIDDAPRTHVEKGAQYERQQIVSDCYALAMKIEHYNAAHPTEEPLQTVLNFEDDVEELKIANGIKKDRDDDKAA
jgi:hypothetical protein